MMDLRENRLDEPHIYPLMELVRELRAQGREVPNVNPNDGGTNAKALFLLETPGPRAVGTGFVSRENPDQSAENMRRLLDSAGFQRADVVLWNVVPYCISSADRNRNASIAQIREAVPETQRFLDRLPHLRVVTFCGRKAQRAKRLLKIPEGVTSLETFHPGARSFNQQRCRIDMYKTFEEAAACCGDGHQAKAEQIS
jgi:hypothetical protein